MGTTTHTGVLASETTTRERVEAITFSPMPDALRNQLTTASFVEVSNRLAAVLGSDDANFCSLAVWPSFTVGASISGGQAARIEGLLSRLPLGDDARRQLTARILRGRADTSDVLQKSLAAGNRGVFYELGLAFVDFLETFGSGQVHGDDVAEVFTEFADRIRRIPDPPGKLWPKQDRSRLIQGLRAYVDAIDAIDERRRSQLILLGNLCIVDYEQCRLQGWLDLSMVGPLRGVTRRLTGRPGTNRAAAALEHSWTRLLTKKVFVVTMADESIRVGRRVPPHASSRGVLYPFPLDVLDPDVGEVFDEIIGRSAGSDGAERWNDLDNRRSFIASLFRSRQRSGLVGLSPYTDDELTVMRAAAAQIDGADAKFGFEGPLLFATRTSVPWAAELTTPLIEQLESARRRGDDDADRVVYDFHRDNPLPVEQRHFTDVMMAIARGTGDTRGVLSAFLDGSPELPEWADVDLCRAAQRMYAQIRPAAQAALFFGTMPAAYAASKGVQPLGLASDLSGNPERRMWESAKFVEDIMTTPFWEKDSDGWASIRGVRLFHAAVRHTIETGSEHIMTTREHAADRVWEAEWGRPINQEDLLGATYDWSIGAIDVMDRIGVPMSQDEARAYLHIWQVVGALLGVEDHLLRSPADPTRAASVEEAHTIAQLILGRQIGPSVAGRRLTEALIGLMDEWFPGPIRRLPRAMMRVCVNDDIAAVIGLPEPRLAERSLLAFHRWGRSWRRNDAYTTSMRYLIHWCGRAWLVWWAREYTDVPPYRRGGVNAVAARVPHRVVITFQSMDPTEPTAELSAALAATTGVSVDLIDTPETGYESSLLTTVMEATADLGADLAGLARSLRDRAAPLTSMRAVTLEIDGRAVSLTGLSDADIDALFPAS
jgi:hypothetical protein